MALFYVPTEPWTAGVEEGELRSLLITEIFPPRTGGSGRWFWEIHRRLPRDEYVIAAGEDVRQQEFDAGHDLAVARVPLSFPGWGLRSLTELRGYWRAWKRLVPLARQNHVEMLYAGRCLPEGVLALSLKCWLKVPYRCYVHGEDVSYAATSREHSFLVRRVFRGAEFVIANSHSTARLLRDAWNLPPERIRVLHPGVDTTRFVPAAPDERVRARPGWTGRTVILTVGRLQQRKGQDHLIEALASVRRACPDVLYAVVGDGEERDALRQLVAERGLHEYVQFLGEVTDDELIRCYQQCDLFALPNRQIGPDIEGFGMVLLEAQACGKPVLAGTSGGTAETMRVGETGIVVDCADPEVLAAALVPLLRDGVLRRRMGEAGRRWVVDHFDWESLTRQAARLFRPAMRVPPLPRVPEPVHQ
jgi:phosphatidylinositol alpha-1,6-mannosyltransferase